MGRSEVSLGLGRAVFSCKDPYYQDMTNFVIKAAQGRIGSLGTTVDLGARIGINSLEIAKVAERVVGVEPDDKENMRYVYDFMHMGDPRLTSLAGNPEELCGVLSARSLVPVDTVLCVEVFQTYHAPQSTRVPQVLESVAKSLKSGGVFAFNLGPSGYGFPENKICDHRKGKVEPGEVMTELCHPLYQRTHENALKIVNERFPDLKADILWPPASVVMSYDFLKSECEKVGLKELQVKEEFSAVNGKRVINFIRNGWSVFFRYGQLLQLEAAVKFGIMEEILKKLFQDPAFDEMSKITSFHPTAVFTAIKA